uniref:Uncharacterized protein n=1 Tax=Rhabditophanes sp. KR3021 TaxID=114890 RepID=A0AC35U651_9BILA
MHMPTEEDTEIFPSKIIRQSDEPKDESFRIMKRMRPCFYSPIQCLVKKSI